MTPTHVLPVTQLHLGDRVFYAGEWVTVIGPTVDNDLSFMVVAENSVFRIDYMTDRFVKVVRDAK